VDDTHYFDAAASLLPYALRRCALGLGPDIRAGAEEFRLRVGRAMTVTCAGSEREIGDLPPVTAQDISSVLESATRASMHTAMDALRQGFITAVNGCRVGICGTAAMRGGEITALRDVSSLVIRIARERRGIADGLLPELCADGALQSTLIISPPGCGKTTLLRDLVRAVSDRGTRVSVADERGEIAASSGGAPKFDIGARTDVIAGAPKQAAVYILLRTMTPRVIALDEITEREDAAAAMTVANCGAALLATIHGENIRDVARRAVTAELFAERVFKKAVIITQKEGRREFTVHDLS